MTKAPGEIIWGLGVGGEENKKDDCQQDRHGMLREKLGVS